MKRSVGNNSVKLRIISTALAVMTLAYLIAPYQAHPARIKDITKIKGVRKNSLFGYGLVIGLSGTGDTSKNVPYATQSVVSMLSRMNITLSPDKIDTLKLKNIASVIVTADMPSFAMAGNKIDVLVSSVGDAKSLKGGLLLLTPLRAADGKVYAVAQGPLSLGGKKGKSKKTNHLTVAKIVGGATVEREISYNFKDKNSFIFTLLRPDFTTAYRIAKEINKNISEGIARPFDAGNIKVRVPFRFKDRKVEFITMIENISVRPDNAAKVVIDERTGTVVFGKNVVISTAAISHGSLSVKIKANTKVVQTTAPAGRARRRRRRRGAEPKGKQVILMKEKSNIDDLVNALNAIGITPEDLITVFQALKAAGALQAELEII